MRQKKINYAYPNSPASIRLNKSKGCWLVDDDSGLPPLVFQESEKKQALNFFRNIKLPINISESFTEDSECFKDVIV